MKINDLNVYPAAPAPVTPPAGEVFADPTMGTEIIRITDQNDGPGFVNNYSAIYDAFNADSTRISYYNIQSGVSLVAALDLKALKVTAKTPAIPGGAVLWSRLNPNVYYCFNGMVLSKFDFASGARTAIRDFSKDFPGQQSIDNRGLSWDDKRFHISFIDGSSTSIYDQSTDTIIGPVSLADAQKVYPPLSAFDWGKTTMDGSGVYVIIASGPQLVYNIQTRTGFLPVFGTPQNQYGDVHGDFGPRGMVASAGGLPGHAELGLIPMMIGPVDPNNLQSYLNQRRQIGPHCMWGIDSHSSFRDGIWNTLTYDAGVPGGADTGKIPIFDAEIFQLSPVSPPDGSLNRRLVRHYSDPSTVSADQAYWAAPKGTTSQDGRALMFNSTYKNARVDAFVAVLKAAPVPPVPDDTTLAGVAFTPEEAKWLQQFALSQLSLQKG